ncbi:protein-tyrosine phosphatase family protein [Citrobacter portucalensis]|uniref:protein-tyrosine phosphatase family protein n=1 Tax=Citrobacter portucalensis TaxID=1639133 RepID=UPI00288B142E|nr:protein-tyrosine phosphatase family protein [Citrobacter portucalensis]WNI88047.1 protein-tyrosine phosphatase family protein [Citrobacter portucalensis]
MNNIPLSSFTSVPGSRNTQLYIKTDNKSGDRKIVTARFGERVLKKIRQLSPQVREEIKKSNGDTLQAFNDALRTKYFCNDLGRFDKTVTDFTSDFAGKPLTNRTVKIVIQRLEKWKESIMPKWSKYAEAPDPATADKSSPVIKAPKSEMNRFNNVITPSTQVILSDGTPMPANKLTYNGSPVSLACSYPLPEYLEEHMQMLVEQKCGCLVVLTPPAQMNKEKLPFYFKGKNKYGNINVDCKKEKGSFNGIDMYNMEIECQGKKHSMKVIHALDWADYGKMSSVDKLCLLAKLVNVTQFIAEGEGKGLPMLHCHGGFGRTGTLAAAMQLVKNPELDINKLITDLRESRSPLMVQTKPQEEQLYRLKNKLEMEQKG